QPTLLRPRCALTAPFHPYPPGFTPAGGIFSVALSVKSALSGSPRPLAGTPSCGDRTFLSFSGATTRPASLDLLSHGVTRFERANLGLKRGCQTNPSFSVRVLP